MQQRLARFALCAVFALLLVGCEQNRQPEGSTPTPAPTATPRPGSGATATAAATAEATATQAATAPAAATPARTETPTPTPAPRPLFIRIANTDGEGVAVRDACDDAARISARGEGIPEGARVEFLAGGWDECDGWMQVRDDKGRESWVRAQFLAPADEEADSPAGAASDASTPAPGDTQPQRTGPRALYYGYAPPGTTIAADIAGVECSRTVTNAAGEWVLFVYHRDCDGAAVSNAVVRFTINGARANEEEIWRSGGGPEDTRYGVTLTVAPTE